MPRESRPGGHHRLLARWLPSVGPRGSDQNSRRLLRLPLSYSCQHVEVPPQDSQTVQGNTLEHITGWGRPNPRLAMSVLVPCGRSPENPGSCSRLIAYRSRVRRKSRRRGTCLIRRTLGDQTEAYPARYSTRSFATSDGTRESNTSLSPQGQGRTSYARSFKTSGPTHHGIIRSRRW